MTRRDKRLILSILLVLSTVLAAPRVFAQSYDPNGALYVDQVGNSGTPIVPGDVNIVKVAGTPLAAQPAAGVLPVGGARSAAPGNNISATLTDYTGSVGALGYCVYNAVPPTNTAGNLGQCQAGLRGEIVTTTNQQANATDAFSNTLAFFRDGQGNTLLGAVAGYGYNGTTWDRLRSVNTGQLVTTIKSSVGTEPAVGSASDGIGNTANAIYTNARLQVYDGSTNYNNARSSNIGTGVLIAAPPDYSYAHIAAGQATTVIKGSKGFLHAVCFNSAATATNITTIYDNASTSGNVIAIPNAVAATVPNCITYDLTAALGIVIITTTANGSDMTVSYR